jgi:hypothetical protein
MLGEVIGFIENYFLPVDDKLALACTVMNPVKAHIDCFGSLEPDGVIGDARGHSAVGGNWSWWLWMTKLFKRDLECASFASIVKEGSKFSFDGAGEDLMHNVAHDMNCLRCSWGGGGWIGKIRCFGWVLGTAAEVMIPSCR